MQWKIKHRLTKQSKPARQRQIINFLLANRELITAKDIKEFLSPENPANISLKKAGFDVSKVATALNRIFSAINNHETILIFGDYDADGICATAILWQTLHHLGAQVLPFIPNRELHGYGLSVKGIQDAIDENKPELIITVDNGIVAFEAADYLQALGIDLIITDHHQLARSLPTAHSIVHNDQICGSAVAWFLAREILSKSPSVTAQNHPIFSIQSTLDLLAIGTISDLMPMLGINRSIAKFGLQTLSTTQNVGLKALKTEAGLGLNDALSTYHVGFVIGPRINAMGRLKDGLDALRLLCTNKKSTAINLAKVLSDTNRLRQDMTQEMVDLAHKIYAHQSHDAHVIIIDHQDFHEGIIGLIAGKLAERYSKPAIIISRGKEISKASARSVDGVNIVELIRTQKDLLINVGGHPGAAGFSIYTNKIKAFISQLSQLSIDLIDHSLLQPTLNIECLVALSDLSQDLYQQLEQFAPFGIGNPRPTFTSTVSVIDARPLGRDQSHIKLKISAPESVTSSPQILDAIGFGMGSQLANIPIGNNVDLAYTLDLNRWKNQTSLQLLIKDIRL